MKGCQDFSKQKNLKENEHGKRSSRNIVMDLVQNKKTYEKKYRFDL